MAWTSSPPDEQRLSTEENEVLIALHQWGLHASNEGHLSIMQQLAVLQHYGSPTRLIDVTFNPLIGLWFAVERRTRNGIDECDECDGRLFAVNVQGRLINESPARSWALAQAGRPWPKSRPRNGSAKKPLYDKWRSEVHAWRPPRMEGRIAAQNGGFIFGGVPAAGLGVTWPKSTLGGGTWGIHEVRKHTSIAIRPHTLTFGPGRPPANALYTLRIKASAKKQIRKKLEELYGYEHSTIYPDYTGFSQYATSHLRTSPRTRTGCC
jgi:hypothetical protein